MSIDGIPSESDVECAEIFLKRRYASERSVFRKFVANSQQLKILTDNFQRGTKSVIETFDQLSRLSYDQHRQLNVDGKGFRCILQGWFEYFIGILDQLKLVNHGVIFRRYHFSQDNLDEIRTQMFQRHSDALDHWSERSELMNLEGNEQIPFDPVVPVHQYSQDPNVSCVMPFRIRSCRQYVGNIINTMIFPKDKKSILADEITSVCACDTIIGQQYVLMANALHAISLASTQFMTGVESMQINVLEMSNKPYNEHFHFMTETGLFIVDGYTSRCSSLEETFCTKLASADLASYEAAHEFGVAAGTMHFGTEYDADMSDTEDEW